MLDVRCAWTKFEEEEEGAWNVEGDDLFVMGDAVGSPYSPLVDAPTLFLELAGLPQREEWVIGLFSLYGFLEAVHKQGEDTREPVAAWYPRIAWLAHHVRLWDLITKQTTESYAELLEMVQIRELQWIDVANPVIPRSKHVPARWMHLPRYERVETVGHSSGDALTDAILAYLTLSLDRELALRPRMTHDRGRQTTTFRVNLPSLWSAAVWQLASSIVAGKRYRQCVICQRWLEEVAAMRDERRTTCSQACKQKLYRQRQRQAHVFLAEGLPIVEIAARLESDVATVQRWVKGT